MFENFSHLLPGYLDYVLGWLLYLPRDLMLVCLAIITSSILTFVRLFSTDQKWLGRAFADGKRLKELTAQAKNEYRQSIVGADRDARRAAAAKWKEARTRYKSTATFIKMKASKYEILPLLASVIPIALLATWAFARVAYIPPTIGEDVPLKMIVPTTAIGKLAYLSPVNGIQSTNGLIQRITLDEPAPPVGWWDISAKKFRAALRATYNFFVGIATRFHFNIATMTEPTPTPRGVAVWHLKATQPGPLNLQIRFDGKSYEKDFLAGTHYYAEPTKKFASGPIQAIQLDMHQRRLFGAIGAIDWLFLPAWLVSYLIIAISFVTVLKRLTRIY